MDGATTRKLLHAAPPHGWPPPDVMSFSKLVEIESCPHKWALEEATYPDVWGGRGYPGKLQMASLAGTVVHFAIQTVVTALVHAGCHSVSTPESTAVMKELGGFTAVITTAIHSVVARYRDNPRAQHLIDYAIRTLKIQVPEMRTQVQTLVLRINLVAGGADVHRAAHPAKGSTRSALRPGNYSELAVHAPTIGWKARVDLLTLTPELCALTEYKTGAPSDLHRLQVRIYALLWYRDNELNPKARRVNKITLSYPNHEVPVDALDTTELVALETSLIERTYAAKRSVGQKPPAALPHSNKCKYCNVRHLCTTYWSDNVQQLAAVKEDHTFTDAEILIQRRHGIASWLCKVIVGMPQLVGKTIMLRSLIDGFDFSPKTHIRALDIHVRMAETSDEAPILTIGSLSEVFLVTNDQAREART